MATSTKTSPFTLVNLDSVDDMAPKFDMGEVLESHFARGALECEQTALAFFRMKPSQRMPFAHRHEHQEEIYVVLSGSGRIMLGDEVRDLKPLDAVRIAPATVRAVESGPDGIELVAFGTPALSDGENDAEMLQGDDAEWPD